MALNDIERAQCEKAINEFLARRRPPVAMRNQLDIECRLTGQSLEIVELRPTWNAPAETTVIPVAKATFVRTVGRWNVYWMRQDRKWHRYEPDLQVKTIADFFQIVERDAHGCFFG